MQALRTLTLITCLAGLGLVHACTRVESTDSPPGPTIGEGGFGGEAEGGSGSLAGNGGDGHGGGSVMIGGAPASIELGIWPTFAAESNDAGDAAAVLAAIEALSAGSSTLPIYERWDSLSGATGSPRAVTWSRLANMTEPYRERGFDVALCIGIVDRSAPAWPAVGELDSKAAALAIEGTIDEVLKQFGGQLSHLCFGYEVDRYLAVASSEAGERLLGLLAHAIDYAEAHPLRSQDTALGVAVTMAAAADPAQLEELGLGDEIVAVYDPLDEDAQLKEPETIAQELDAVVAALPVQANDELLPLTLFEAGFPSGAGASEKVQRAYYEALFSALGTHADQVAFVGLFGLGDRAAAECEAEALVFGSAEPERAAVRCSMGLRADSGVAKLAWPSVVAALSRYR